MSEIRRSRTNSGDPRIQELKNLIIFAFLWIRRRTSKIIAQLYLLNTHR